MSKFNERPAAPRTVNREGHAAYVMSNKEHLVSAVLTTMFGEPKFYGSTDNDIIKLATSLCRAGQGGFVCRLAAYTRNVANLRSVSHVLVSVIAREANNYTRVAVRNVIVRPDDITEIVACYKKMYGKPFPNALKRELANQIRHFNEYQLAKYNGGNKDITFRDVLRITHPVPSSQEESDLFGRIINDTLETPYTWETELSKNGNNRETWNKLIASGKVGYMALLRNLRNIIRSGANCDPVFKKLADPEMVRNSKQMPYRYLSAYRTLRREGYCGPAVVNSLEAALEVSIANMPTIPGRTFIAVDVSGSMDSSVSHGSDICCGDIGVLFGVMASKICEDATVCYFNADHSRYMYPSYVSHNKEINHGYEIAHYGKYTNILDKVATASYKGGTDMSLPFKAMEKENNTFHPYDRMIIFSDNECNCQNGTMQHYAEDYRRKYNLNFWVHGVDLLGYGTQQFCGQKFNLIAGWNERVLDYILLAEKGFGNLVKTIEMYELK